MRYVVIPSIIMLGIGAATALAQVPSGADPATGARPGHAIGVGDSLPLSNNASNITAADTKSNIAPTLPQPDVGPNSTPQDYLRAARASLVANQTGAAQQSLEMAETRMLDRSVRVGQTNVAIDTRLSDGIRDARKAVGSHDNQRAIQIIDRALSS